MIAAIVQARMGSTRLPGKVMLEGAGQPLLGHLLERLGYSRHLAKIVVATSTNPRDDIIKQYCSSVQVPVFRGSEHDVLDRYFQAARALGITVVVRVTSDCPLLDPELIDEQLERFAGKLGDYDLITNRHPLTYVDGLDFDIIPIKALEAAWGKADRPHQREHVVPFFWEAGLRVHNFEDPHRLFYVHRWSLDYPEDYELIRWIYRALYTQGRRFATKDVIEYLSAHPDVSKVNAKHLPVRS
jgi:spore coat polysaccharide biosynthesis protein SpsF